MKEVRKKWSLAGFNPWMLWITINILTLKIHPEENNDNEVVIS